MDKFYGVWKINKKKSESIDELLKFFGVPYIARKMIGDDNTLVITKIGKGDISIKDIIKGNETEEIHKFENKFLQSIDKRGNPVKRKAVYKDDVITLMTLSNNNIMIIRQLDVRGSSLRDRIYYKKYGDKEFKSVIRFYNRENGKNAKGGGYNKKSGRRGKKTIK